MLRPAMKRSMKTSPGPLGRRGSGLRMALMAAMIFGSAACDVPADAPMTTPEPDGPPLAPDEIRLKIAQRCPGDPDCVDQGDNVLYVGYGAEDITPEVETFTDLDGNGLWDAGEPYDDKNKNGVFDAYWLAGFDQGRIAKGVADPVWARALAIRQNLTTVVLVAVDTVGLFRDETPEIEKLIDPRLGIDLLMVHATHVHEAPDLTGGWGPNPFTWGVNEGYQKMVRQKIAAAVTAAVQGVLPARLTVSSVAVEDPGHDMSRYIADTRDPVVIDNTLHTLHFVERDSVPPRPIATLVNWANHPEASGGDNQLITSDFVHPLREQMEKKGAGPVVYVSGALGGLLTPLHVTPLDEKGMPVPESGLPKARALGMAVAGFALNALADPGARQVEGKDARLSFRTTIFPAHVENVKYHLASMVGIFRRSFCCYDNSRPLDDTNVPSVETKVAYLQLGPASIITNPGELAGELFLGGYGGEHAGTYKLYDPMAENAPDLSKAPKGPYLIDYMDGARSDRMTFGLTMDFLGYILPRYNFVLDEKSPYFSSAKGDHYEETNSIGPRAEAEIVGTMRQLLQWRATPPYQNLKAAAHSRPGQR